jgi:hypothetical protein
MRANGSHAQPLTTVLEIHDRNGNKVGEKEVAAYAGILALAHEDGLRSISTKLVQIPTKDNGMVAIATAKVRTNKGTFEGIGDADPANVNSKIVRHLIRMAETRAKARALRDAVNIGLVTLEELGDMIEDELSAQSPATRPSSRQPPSQRPGNDNGASIPPNGSGLPNANETQFKKMSDAQRGLLFRISGERGVAPPEQESWVLTQLGAQTFDSVSRFAASQAIDRLTAKKPNGANGGNGASGTAVH